MRPNWRLTAGVLLAGLALSSARATAEPIQFAQCITGTCIDFGNLSQPGGTVSYDGSGGPLVGTGIPILGMNGLNTPQNSTPPAVPIVNGLLNFQTGPLIATAPLGGYEFGGGGHFTITGAVPTLGLEDDETVLLAGVFSGANFGFGPAQLPTQFAVSPRGTDLKHAAIMEHFGLNPGTLMSYFGIIVTSPPLNGLDGGGFSVTALNVDIPNAPAAPVPEPASLLLLGAGTGGAILARRRNRRA